MSPYLIVGLGNPGKQYATTRHNIGRMALEELSTRTFPTPAQLRTHAKTRTQLAEARLQGSTGTDHRVLLASPSVFMNLSGGPVKAVQQFFKIAPERTIVFYDDLELDFGAIKIRTGGGDHGHKGLRSISQATGTKEYIRVGIGIGRPPGRQDVSSFVLKSFSSSENKELPFICSDAADALIAFL